MLTGIGERKKTGFHADVRFIVVVCNNALAIGVYTPNELGEKIKRTIRKHLEMACP